MIKVEEFNLPSVTISTRILQESKEEDNSSLEDQPIQEGKWSEIIVKGTMQGKCREAERGE